MCANTVNKAQFYIIGKVYNINIHAESNSVCIALDSYDKCYNVVSKIVFPKMMLATLFL